jgi:hypothetical protein
MKQKLSPKEKELRRTKNLIKKTHKLEKVHDKMIKKGLTEKEKQRLLK